MYKALLYNLINVILANDLSYSHSRHGQTEMGTTHLISSGSYKQQGADMQHMPSPPDSSIHTINLCACASHPSKHWVPHLCVLTTINRIRVTGHGSIPNSNARSLSVTTCIYRPHPNFTGRQLSTCEMPGSTLRSPPLCLPNPCEHTQATWGSDEAAGS